MAKERLIQIFKKHTPNTQMSEEEMRIFIGLATTKEMEFGQPIEELDKDSEVYKHFKPLIDGFQMQVFLSRLKHMTSLRITLGAFIVIAQHLNSAGCAVMYAFYLDYKLQPNTLIDVNTIALRLFPYGFFSEEQLREIWEEQKVQSKDGLDESTCIGAHDNPIDYLEN